MRKIDLTGKTFGNWMVLMEMPPEPGGHIQWKCRCICGEERNVVGTSLTRGISISCGCIKPKKMVNNTNDYINRRFGRLLVVSLTTPVVEKNNKMRTGYLCKCDCGKELIIKRHTLQNPRGPKSCGCLLAEQRSNLGLNKRKLPPNLASAKIMYSKIYADGNLSFDEFIKLSQMNCYYCNSQPINSYNKYLHRDKWGKNSQFAKDNGTFIYNGLDRIDSSLPHNIDNIVPCCFDCNRAKTNNSQDEFGEWICKVYKNWAKQYDINL